jgi:ClpP class serine protease
VTIQAKFDRQGLLALDPRAFMGSFVLPPNRDNVTVGDVEIVTIGGPLEYHVSPPMIVNGLILPPAFDCYDAIVARVSAALAGTAKTVVLRIDSPGGMVAGGFDAVRTVRALAKSAGKPLIAYVDTACSMGYAWACAADRIVASSTAVSGSIGVIDTRVDTTAMDTAMGARFAFITSGSRKADGNPHQAMSVAELVERQAQVDTLAGVFFALVQDMRGFDAAPLEARCFVGAQAKEAGLVDEIQSFGDLLASLASARGETMATKFDEARAALEEAAKGDGEEAQRAQRALKAMDGDDDGDEPAAESDDAESDDDKEKEKEPESSAAAASAASAGGAPGEGAISAATAAALAAEIQRLSGNATKDEATRRKELLATRADISSELRAILSKTPLAEVKAVLGKMPAPPKSTAVKAPPANASSATPRAALGDGQGNGGAPRSPVDIKSKLDLQMGLSGVQSTGVVSTPHSLTLGAPVTVREGKAG